MRCEKHVKDGAEYTCSICGEPLCRQCMFELHGKIYCEECLKRLAGASLIKQKHYEPNKGRKSKTLTFFLSLIPGAGHNI